MSLFHDFKGLLDSMDELAAEVSDSNLSEDAKDALFMSLDQAIEVLKETMDYLH